MRWCGAGKALNIYTKVWLTKQPSKYTYIGQITTVFIQRKRKKGQTEWWRQRAEHMNTQQKDACQYTKMPFDVVLVQKIHQCFGIYIHKIYARKRICANTLQPHTHRQRAKERVGGQNTKKAVAKH